MIIIPVDQYNQLDEKLSQQKNPVTKIRILDYLGGVTSEGKNFLFDKINKFAESQQQKITVVTGTVFTAFVTSHYSWLDFESCVYEGLQQFHNYNTHPELTFENFVCSFNGTEHVSRKLLTALLYRFKWFDPNYCTKNFCFDSDTVDGHVAEYCGGVQSDLHKYFRKFFISNDQDDRFFREIYSFEYERFDHAKNIYNLQHRICSSFLHVVSESLATSYYPIVSEKFCYSLVNRGLFLTYGQPGWHAYLEKYFGFKRYTKIFDYQFDTIENPVERLLALATMISKFSYLSSDDWRDLYLLEQDTIEFNYDHYFSQNYLKCRAKYS